MSESAARNAHMKHYSLACQFLLMMQTYIRTIRSVSELVEQFL